MSCIGECLDLGPPPDLILFLPPPPAPSILQHSLPDLLLNTTPCSAGQLCDAWVPLNKFPDSDFVELSRKEVETWSSIDDTWLLVLIASSIGILLIGALLAIFLLKFREEPRPMKILEQRDCPSSNGKINPNNPSWHNGNVGLHDNRIVWAALTPGGGTQHFISENYPKEFVDYREADDHYETIDNLTMKPAIPAPVYQSYQKGSPYQTPNERSHFDNSGFVDYEYEEPMPLIKSYQYSSYDDYQYTLPGGNTDMRCISMAYGTNSMRRHLPPPITRPRVSSPTRIEHPNLPPLNMYPLKSSTLKRNNNLSYRNVDTGTLPKYTC
ncbi:uncharacterized protein LOC123318865 isoform X2 [Coccinella septempunctata]|uniref:uncharacterized protein LOC123318865 isoform X2 n=1 Tax=Coccinella septempunctata TaxID=41139 RepID=UPI001D06F511|nr:uncharacterized protein LOC123318865 isoform X2 [Coccinella septempunctata]